jgi:hypothetical protein
MIQDQPVPRPPRSSVIVLGRSRTLVQSVGAHAANSARQILGSAFASYKRFEPTFDSNDTSAIIAGCKVSATACMAVRHNCYVQVSTIARPQPMSTLQARLLEEATMARRAVVHLVDDLDETIIEDGDGQIVSFGLDGTTYEIDLTNEHADALRRALARYVEAARQTGSDRPARAGGTGRSRSNKSDVSPTAVREWAKANGIEVSARGRIPQSVVDQFRAAGN